MRACTFIRHVSRVTAFWALAAFALAPGVASQTRAEDLFQQALRMERVSGDLEGAIRLYQQVVDAGDRTLGARALVRMAESYEKLGREGARQAYARIIDEFGDQTEEVALARERLAELEGPAGPRRPGRSGITTRRLHRSVGGEDLPLAISPDGQGLIYLDLWFGPLAVRDLSNGQTRAVFQDDLWSAWGATVSPDGQTVAFVVAEDRPNDYHSIYLAGIDGSQVRLLNRETGCPTWNLVWTSDGESIIALRQCGKEPPRVMRFALSGEAPEELARLEGALDDVWKASLSPDDQFLVYDQKIEGDGGNFDVWLVSLASGARIPLVRHPAHDALLGWVPESDEVLFLSDREGTMDAWAVHVSADGSTGRPRIVQRDMGQVDPLGFSRDGSFYYNVYKRWFSTSVAPFNMASGTVDIASATGILGSVTPPAWSPDGERLAFVPELEGPRGSGGPYKRPLHVLDLSTGSRREFASHLQIRDPRWSPDGRFILFCGGDPLVEQEFFGGLYLLNTESGEVTHALELAGPRGVWGSFGAVWSPEGDAVLYSIFDPQNKEGRLIRLDLESGEERVLFQDSTLTTQQMAVSPDRRHLVFGRKNNTEGNSARISRGGRLVVMDLDDGEVKEVHRIEEPGRVNSLQWAPNGESILYTKRGDDDQTWLWRVPASGGSAERVWAFEESYFDAYIQVRPDGEQAAYTTYHQENEVWVMENLREVLLGAAGR